MAVKIDFSVRGNFRLDIEQHTHEPDSGSSVVDRASILEGEVRPFRSRPNVANAFILTEVDLSLPDGFPAPESFEAPDVDLGNDSLEDNFDEGPMPKSFEGPLPGQMPLDLKVPLVPQPGPQPQQREQQSVTKPAVKPGVKK